MYDPARIVDEYEPNRLTRDPFPNRTSLIEAALDSGEADLIAAALAAIDLLDFLDGDPDLEPCMAGDDGCHYFLCGGNEGWGALEEDDGGECAVYGVDQSEGPLNTMGRPRESYEAFAWRG